MEVWASAKAPLFGNMFKGEFDSRQRVLALVLARIGCAPVEA